VLQPEKPRRRGRADDHDLLRPEQPTAELRGWLKERLPGSPCVLAELTEELSEGFGDVGPLGSVDAACDSQELQTRVFPTLVRLAKVRDDAELHVMIGRFGLTELAGYLESPTRSRLLIDLYSALLQGIWESAGIAVEACWPQLGLSSPNLPQQLWLLALGDSAAYDPLLGGLVGRGISSTLRPMARRPEPARRSAWIPDLRRPAYDDFTRPRLASSSHPSAAPATHDYSEPVSGIVPALPRPGRDEPDHAGSPPVRDHLAAAEPEAVPCVIEATAASGADARSDALALGRPTSMATIWTLCCAIVAVSGLAILFAPLHSRPDGTPGPKSLLGLRVVLPPLGPSVSVPSSRPAARGPQPSAAGAPSAPLEPERAFSAPEPLSPSEAALASSTDAEQAAEGPRPARRPPVEIPAPDSVIRQPADDQPLPYVIEFSPIPGDATLAIGDQKITGFGTLLVSELPESVTLVARRAGYQTRIINIARSTFSEQAGVYWRRLYVTLRSNEEVAAVLDSSHE
jgi:hypothetical protein